MRNRVALLGVLLLVGCLPPSQQQLRMEMDLEQMKRRLAQLEVQQAETATSGSIQGDDRQRQLAEIQAGLDTLRVDFQSINGRLDDLGREKRQLLDDLQMAKDDMGLQLSALSARVDALEQRPAAATAPTAGGTTEVLSSTPAESPEGIYQDALDKIRKEEQFAAGREQLDRFLSQYPKHDLYTNALYWKGEALYGEKKYELSILQFQDVISQFPKHPKAPAAMLKQAMAFNALGDNQNARTTMQKLIDSYPQSEQIDAAKKFLNR